MEGFTVTPYALSHRSLSLLFFISLFSLTGTFAATRLLFARQANVPQARPDNYCASPGNELKTTVARGVLANDMGSPLTIVGNTNPANGTLKLNGDGSFSYTPM